MENKVSLEKNGKKQSRVYIFCLSQNVQNAESREPSPPYPVIINLCVI